MTESQAKPRELQLLPLTLPVPPRLSVETRDALQRLAEESQRKSLARLSAWGVTMKAPAPATFGKNVVEPICALMEAQEIPPGGLHRVWGNASEGFPAFELGELKTFLKQPELELLHVVRFLVALGLCEKGQRGQSLAWVDDCLRHYRESRGLSFGLREVGVAFRASGLESSLIGWSRLDSYSEFDWEPEAVWPYFLEHIAILEEALEPRSDAGSQQWWRPLQKANALAVLEMFPRIPTSVQPKLWELALGSAKADRAAAQRCLMKEPDTPERVMAVLGDSRREARVAAAAWLGQIKHKEAVPALERALATEKQDGAKAVLMGALETLGVPVDRFLDRKGLAAGAEKGLRNGIPSALSWFPWSGLPAVHWEDNGEAVTSRVLTWLVVQSQKLGTPEAGALLRRYAREMRPTEREALGQFVLESWIACDIHLPTRDEIEPKARQLAQQLLPLFPGQTVQEVTEVQIEQLMKEPKGSTITSKGVLAVAAASAGPRAVPVVEQYLRHWYGYRAAQCRALIQMLSWLEHPSAVQLLLSIATRFRTASIRKEAEKNAALVAERKGWSVAELADRSIPTAGFDEKRMLLLDYGKRQFTARLGEDFKVTLFNPDGEPISSLPPPRSDDSPEAVAAAKQVLASAKKELKSVVKLQRERLYEAMCTCRTWPLSDWETFLRRHPIVGRYCERLVWAAQTGEAATTTFRPLDDGSLTDPQHGEVHLAETAVVSIAHGRLASDAESKAWLTHLADYKVEPLFAQFGRDFYKLPSSMRHETQLNEVLGHLIEAFKLRGRATQLGYLRGTAEEGGWFYVYRKNFATIGIEAIIEFSGNPLPEENRTVALKHLYFVRAAPRQGIHAERRVQLGEVPRLLLAECVNDLRAIASDGSGFHADWEKKVAP